MRIPARYWKPLRVNDEDIDLAHLEPHDFICVTPDSATRKVHVTYSNHVFIEKFDSSIHNSSNLVYRDRAFNNNRYELSKQLSGLVEKLPNVKVYQTWEKRNYVYFISLEGNADTPPYHMFFEIKKVGKGKKGRLNMTVESAYSKHSDYSNPTKKCNSVRFIQLVQNVYLGRSVSFR